MRRKQHAKPEEKNLKMQEKELLELMFEHQDRLNLQIHPNWRKQNFPWHRAIWMECAELMDCFPWKWWAETEREPDWENVKIELADLWHFVLSWALQEDFELEVMLRDWEETPGPIDTFGQIEYMVNDATSFYKQFRHLHFAFVCLSKSLKLDLKSLARIYFGKNVLNRFRQAHGLKDGRYRREWNGIEDNRVMLRLIEDLEVLPLERFEAELARRLEEAYERAGI